MRIKHGSLICTVCALFSAYEAALVLTPPSFTEIKQEGDSNDSLNPGFINKHLYPKPDEVTVKCKMLRSKRLISDGFCVSPKFVKERVCAGQCHPTKQDNLPWWGEFLKYWDSQYIKQWRCKEGLTKRRKVKLLCENGEIRTYKIKVVKSCNCVQYSNKNNEFKSKIRRQRRKRRRQRAKRRRAHGKNSKNNRQYLNSNSPEL